MSRRDFFSLLDLWKNIYFRKSYSTKLFVCFFSQIYLGKYNFQKNLKQNIFKKNTQKWKFPKYDFFNSKKYVFSKIIFFHKSIHLEVSEKILFRKNIFLEIEDFFKIWKFPKCPYFFLKIFFGFFENYIFPNRFEKKVTQKVLGCNFFKNKYFFINPKAKIVPWPLLSKTSKNIENGWKLEKLSHFFVRG